MWRTSTGVLGRALRSVQSCTLDRYYVELAGLYKDFGCCNKLQVEFLSWTVYYFGKP